MAVNLKESIQNCLADAGLKELPIDWDVLELGSILDNDRGISVGVMYPGKFCSAGTPLIKAGDLKHDYINPLPDFYISPEKHYEHRRTALEGGEILLSLVGNLGQCAVVPSEMAGFNIARAVASIRLHQPKDAEFVKLCLQSPPLQYLMQSWATTTVQATLNLKEIKKLPIPWPNITEREAIVSVLKPLLNKIELNRRMNETLEAMAKALFKSWFVDFDPVYINAGRAKAEGRPPEGLTPEIAALFPDAFEDSELGEIPKGWEVDQIGNLVSAVGGGTPSTTNLNFWNEPKHAWATPKDLSNLGSPILTSTERQISDEGLAKISSGLLPKGSILLSSRAPIGYVAIANMPVAINQGFIGLICDKEISSPYIWQWVYHNLDLIKSRANGSTFLEVSKANFRPILALKPTSPIIEAFGASLHPIIEKITMNVLLSQNLTQIRDSLLPKLMSGEIRVQQADALVEAVV